MARFGSVPYHSQLEQPRTQPVRDTMAFQQKRKSLRTAAKRRRKNLKHKKRHLEKYKQ